jgi:hypothetical protein
MEVIMAEEFNGLGMNLGNLSRLTKAESRSISAENFSGEKGKGSFGKKTLNTGIFRGQACMVRKPYLGGKSGSLSVIIVDNPAKNISTTNIPLIC